MKQSFDAVVVGGGAAGLGAALTLSRARRSVLVVDDGHPRNAPAGHVHGYPGREGAPPTELLATGRAEVEQYGGRVRSGRVSAVSGARGEFTVRLGTGEELSARRLLLATGLVDVLPDVAGLRERWGRDVLHCPYCHGWEVRDQRIGVIASPVMPTHLVQLFRQWSDRVTLFSQDAELTSEDRAGLDARAITLVEGVVDSLEVEDDRLVGAGLTDGRTVGLDALVVPPRMEARTELGEALGAAVAEMPFGRHLEVDGTGATTVPGVWALGNAADLSAQVVMAAAAGVRAGAMVNADLVQEEIAAARRDADPSHAGTPGTRP